VLLGILSDTHDQLDRTKRAINLLWARGAKGLVHCGDLFSPAIVEACSVLPTWFVLGNHDADNVPLLEEAAQKTGITCLGWSGIIHLNDKLIAVAHGHMSYDIRRALAQRPHYLLTGHSHIPHDRMEGIVRRINPGALFDADEFTVALLNLDTDQLEFLAIDPDGSEPKVST